MVDEKKYFRKKALDNTDYLWQYKGNIKGLQKGQEGSPMSTTEADDWVQCGRQFSAQEIKQIRETVTWLPGLARRELAATVCEHLNWHTASGTPKIQACQKLLERLEAGDPSGLSPTEEYSMCACADARKGTSTQTCTLEG